MLPFHLYDRFVFHHWFTKLFTGVVAPDEQFPYAGTLSG